MLDACVVPIVRQFLSHLNENMFIGTSSETVLENFKNPFKEYVEK